MTDVSIFPLIFTTHCLSTCFFVCFNDGIKQGGGGGGWGSNNWFILQAHMQALKPTKKLLHINATHPYATVALKMLLHDHCDSNNQMSERTHVPRRPCYIFFVRIASWVETQYLVSAIRQFSSEVECPANGLLMFSLEKNRTIQTHSMKKVCCWISVNLCHI